MIRKASTTTTILAKLIPQLLAAQVEKTLRLRATLLESVIQNTDLLVPGFGDTVFIPLLPDLGMAADLVEGTDMIPVAQTPATSVPLVPTERGVIVEAT